MIHKVKESTFKTKGLEVSLSIMENGERVVSPETMTEITRWLDSHDCSAKEIMRLGAWVAGEVKGEGE